jgi:hypothetical protein
VRAVKKERSDFRRIMRARLRKIPGLEHAFVFGSGPAVNLLLVGDFPPGTAAHAAADLEKVTGRQVNCVASTSGEIQDRLRRGDPFVGAVLNKHFKVYGDARGVDALFGSGNPGKRVPGCLRGTAGL